MLSKTDSQTLFVLSLERDFRTSCFLDSHPAWEADDAFRVRGVLETLKLRNREGTTGLHAAPLSRINIVMGN